MSYIFLISIIKLPFHFLKRFQVHTHIYHDTSPPIGEIIDETVQHKAEMGPASNPSTARLNTSISLLDTIRLIQLPSGVKYMQDESSFRTQNMRIGEIEKQCMSFRPSPEVLSCRAGSLEILSSAFLPILHIR